MPALKIILLCTLAAIAYGVAHDQITARICLEYFTVFHPPWIASESPTLQALVWGVGATWWVGVGLGIPLALAARVGTWPRRDARQLARPIAYVFIGTALCAALAGLIGYALATSGAIWVAPPWDELIPRERHVRFLIAGWMHSASYIAGAMGGWMVIFATLLARAKAARMAG